MSTDKPAPPQAGREADAEERIKAARESLNWYRQNRKCDVEYYYTALRNLWVAAEDLFAAVDERYALRKRVAELEHTVYPDEILAKHSGGDRREWHSQGAWLHPGECIAVVPLELINGRMPREKQQSEG